MYTRGSVADKVDLIFSFPISLSIFVLSDLPLSTRMSGEKLQSICCCKDHCNWQIYIEYCYPQNYEGTLLEKKTRNH